VLTGGIVTIRINVLALRLRRLGAVFIICLAGCE